MSEPTESKKDREDLDLLLRGFQVSRMLRLVADLWIADKIAREGAVNSGRSIPISQSINGAKSCPIRTRSILNRLSTASTKSACRNDRFGSQADLTTGYAGLPLVATGRHWTEVTEQQVEANRT